MNNTIKKIIVKNMPTKYEIKAKIINKLEIILDLVKTIMYIPLYIGIFISLKLFGHTIFSYNGDKWPDLHFDYYDYLINNYCEIVTKRVKVTTYKENINKKYPEKNHIDTIEKETLYSKFITDKYCRKMFFKNKISVVNKQNLLLSNNNSYKTKNKKLNYVKVGNVYYLYKEKNNQYLNQYNK